ncbi:MAG: PBP1A family penicillin-binding protein [Melioribacteraceae bacterium]|nr:PBP1A family penicillin-binding protein [Melioribacteraceae bacterium]
MSKTKVKSKKKSLFKKLVVSISVFLFIGLLVGGFFFYSYVESGLPSLEELENPKPKLASNVFSTDGELIGQFFRKNRIEASLDSIPQHLVNALIATEDRAFYDHWGVDLERFVKAMIKSFFLQRREGGSTITQQLSKNLYDLRIPDESLYDTGVRKIREWITAFQIEKTYTKKEILEMYLNISYFGYGAYGIEVASNVYFNKHVSQLTVPEAALFIGLLKSSVYYNPYKKYDNARMRRNLVMYNMVQTGFLSAEEYNQFKELPIELEELDNVKSKFKSTDAPHFVEYIRQQLEDLSEVYNFDLYEDGLNIYTSLNLKLQKLANAAAVSHVEEYQKTLDQGWYWGEKDETKELIIDEAIRRHKNYRNASSDSEKRSITNILRSNIAFIDSVQREAQRIEVGFVVLDTETGGIRAMVGARDQGFRYGLNHVTQIKRQPGSSFKPVIYTVAIDNGLYPSYPIINQLFSVEGWMPRNFSKTTGGFLTLRDALKSSVNVITARLIIEDHVQLWQIGQYASKMGIKSRLRLTPAISLGTSEVTPLELTSVYATIANKGIYNEPISILRIEDKDGILIDQFYPETREAISEETAYIISDMLSTVINRGTGARVRSMYEFYEYAGGKTGTSQSYADTWFMGFTSHFAAGVWVGFDDHRIKFPERAQMGTGSRAALPVWAKFMKAAYDSVDLPERKISRPESGNVVDVNYCYESIYKYGNPKLASGDCEEGIVTDIALLNQLPAQFNSTRDTTINLFTRYLAADSTAHEAIDIIILDSMRIAAEAEKLKAEEREKQRAKRFSSN